MRTLRRSLPLRGLALAALVFELILAFAHVHVAHGARPARSGGAVALACRTIFAPGPERGCPPLRQSHQDECQVCKGLAQAGAGLLPVPPAVPGVATLRLRLAPEEAQAPLLAAALAPFQARAPPHVGA